MSSLGKIRHHLIGPVICANVTGQYAFIGSVDDPFRRNYPVFMRQFICITFAYLTIRLILRPLRQPRFVCSILAGIAVNAIIRGDYKYFVTIPKEELMLARTVGALGTTYLLFLTSVKADITAIHRTMRSASIIGSSSVLMPFVMTALVAHKLTLPGMKTPAAQPMFIIGLSLTRFPNVVHAFNELNMTTSDLGQLAVSCSVVSEAIVWLFMFLGAYVIKPSFLLYTVLTSAAFLLLIFGIVRPVIMLIIEKVPERKPVSEIYISSILVVALVMAALTDMIGSINFGVMMLGLVIPNGPPLGATLSEKIELVTLEILMPMFYVVIGFNIDVSLVDWKVSREILLIVLMNTLLKIVGALVAALCCKLRLQHSVLLGLMLGIKGPYDVYLLNRWLVQDIDRKAYTVTVLSQVAITAVLTPLIDVFYNPHRRLSESVRKSRRSMQTHPSNVELRILCCIHSEDDVPGIISLLEASNPTGASPICAYAVHLNELVGRATPFIVPYNRQMRRTPSKISFHIMRALDNYSTNSNHLVKVKPYMAIAAYKTMHEYICRLAQDELVPLIVLPFHGSQEMSNATKAVALRNLAEKIQAYAPCTIGTLVDTGMHHRTNKSTTFSCRVGVIFVGGSDDREALALAFRMVGRPNVRVTVVHIIVQDVGKDIDEIMQEKIDNGLIEVFRAKADADPCSTYRQVVVEDSEQAMGEIQGLKNKFSLVLVGQKRGTGTVFPEETMLNWSDNPELGVIGDLVASSDFRGETTSVLVMHHHGDPKVPFRDPSMERERDYLLRRSVC
ncbi:cation/H(+) antiporter 15-like [Rhodamnia argentea]|uniref:Cation/H(+) antiporter 15-like n=1 Tax=Rhodamnia argentea TaxID=178133 RepID=A0A8B8N6J0_9MYRT|nr:cation/H(+) antiporter 15-like [Rhodamnia argentea]